MNFTEWSSHLTNRVHRQAVASGDPRLATLREALRQYADTEDTPSPHSAEPALSVPLVLRDADQQLQFFSTLTVRTGELQHATRR